MNTILLTVNVDIRSINKDVVSAHIAEKQQKIDKIFSDIKDINVSTILIPNYNSEIKLISSSPEIENLKIFAYYVNISRETSIEASEKLILAESESKNWIKNSTDNIKIIVVEKYDGMTEIVEIYNSEKNYKYKI